MVEKTIIKIPSKFKSKSYMIIDGKFLCIDPFLGTKFHLLSSNKYSKIEIKESYFPNFKSKKKLILIKVLSITKNYLTLKNLLNMENYISNLLNMLNT